MHHDLAEHGVERLDDLGTRELALDLLAQAVGVGDGEHRRHALAHVERQGDVDEHLAGQVLGADALQCLDAVRAVAGVHHQLGERSGFRQLQQPDIGVLGSPLRVGRGAEGVVLGAGHRGLRVTGADRDLVAKPCEAGGEHATDHASADDCDLHDCSSSFQRIRWKRL